MGFKGCFKILVLSRTYRFQIQNRFGLFISHLMNQQAIVAPVGIDLGSYTSKIAVAKRGGVEIITNEANFRETPCVVGYGPAERQIGESGKIKMNSNWKDTVTFPARFLGLSQEYPFLRAEKKFCPAKCTTKDNKVAFQVKYQGQPETLYPQQIFAAYLNKLKVILQKNNFDNKAAVIAVPTYFTQQERRAVLDAAKIAELEVTRLLNESTAIALDYGIFRKNELDANNPRNVLFIDFGHSKLSIFLCSFTNTQMNVLEQQHCRHIGCRDIDYHLFEFYRGIFQKSSGGCDLTENRKAVLKMMENIERQRKILSGNMEHDLNIEYLMEENDLHYCMKRDQFEKISQPIYNAISEVMNKLKDTIHQKKINLHSIQLVGGGSRIPGFINIVRKVFGTEPSRTLNSSESVARGCALMAAIKSPLFRVADYALNEKSYYGIKFYWNFVEGDKFLGLNSELYPEKQGKYIYDVGAKVPTSKTVKFARKEAIEVLIQYEPLVNGFGKHIGYYVTKPQNPKEETFGVSFKIKFNENGLVTFEECSLIEEWFEETKVPKKKKEEKKDEKKEQKKEENKDPAKPAEPTPEKMDVEEEFDIKKTKKEKHTQIKYESNTFEPFSPKDIESFFTMQSTMHNQDILLIETYQRKNQLQSLIYTWKERVVSNYQQFTKAEEVPDILNFLEQQNEWLYNDGQNANRGAYNERINGIKNKVANIVKRYDNFQATINELQKLDQCMKVNSDSLNSLDKKYEHISPEQRQEGHNIISNAREWVMDANEKQKKTPKYQDLAINAQQIKDKIKEINDKCKKIMSKPLPPPPPKEEKKEEKAAAAAGEKMEAEPQSNPAEPEKMQTE